MAGEWKKTRIGDCFDLVGGYAFKSYQFIEKGIPVIKIKNVKANRMLFDDLSYVSPDFLKTRGDKIIQKGDLLITMSGNRIDGSPDTWVGKVAQFNQDRPFMLNQRVGILRPKANTDVDRRYFCFSLSSNFYQTEFISIATSSGGQANLSPSQILGAPIICPPLAEQKAIAAVLGALDDKIELNRRMNATLEAMARALFKSWFVDFDPVRAKLDGRKPVGLDEATAALFPDSFQDSAVGQIPNGWKVGVLDELTKFVIGGDWGATGPTDDETVSCYCIRGADIPSLQSGGVGKMPTRFLKPSSLEKRQLADGDLAIEISGGSPTQCTGRPVLASEALLQNLGQPLVASNFCRIVKLKSPAFSKFVYFWLLRLYDSGELFQFETGTTGIKNFAFVIFSERYPLVVPDLRVAEAFDRTVSPFFARIQENSQESRTLATLRDTLLPKLLSGELSVDKIKEGIVA